jgi:hypothetical protein
MNVPDLELRVEMHSGGRKQCRKTAVILLRSQRSSEWLSRCSDWVAGWTDRQWASTGGSVSGAKWPMRGTDHYFHLALRHRIYCHIYRVCVCGSVTNNNTWVRIGYRIYSLWRFITTQITIINCWCNSSQLIQTEWSHFTNYCNSSKHWLPHSIIHCEHCALLIPETHWWRLTHALA